MNHPQPSYAEQPGAGRLLFSIDIRTPTPSITDSRPNSRPGSSSGRVDTGRQVQHASSNQAAAPASSEDQIQEIIDDDAPPLSPTGDRASRHRQRNIPRPLSVPLSNNREPPQAPPAPESPSSVPASPTSIHLTIHLPATNSESSLPSFVTHDGYYTQTHHSHNGSIASASVTSVVHNEDGQAIKVYSTDTHGRPMTETKLESSGTAKLKEVDLESATYPPPQPLETEKSPSGKPDQQSDVAAAAGGGGGGGASGPDSAPPDGGLEAWLLVAGGTVILFMSFGLTNSFGIFQNYYSHNTLKNESISNISWIGSVQTCAMLFGSLFAGAAFDRVGARPLIVGGSLLLVISCFLISWDDNYPLIMASQGILQGLANAALFSVPIAATQHWFAKKRGLALGIVTGGSSLGGVMWPIVVNKLLTTVGQGWTWRILGFIAIFLLSFSAIVVKGRLPLNAKSSLINPTAFKSPAYTLFTIAAFLVYMGLFFVFFFLPSYGVKYGMSASLADYSVSILNACSFVGRLVCGFASDKLGHYNVFLFSAAASAGIVFAMTAAKEQNSILAVGAVYGFCSGAVVAVQGACIAKASTEPRKIGVNIGQLFAVISPGTLLGAPISGWIIAAQKGDYLGAQLFNGSLIALGAIFTLLAKLALDRNPLAKI